MKTLDFLEILTLCQGCQYEKIKTGKFIFKNNEDTHTKFYVILSGQVGMLISKKDEFDMDDKTGKKKSKRKKAKILSTLAEATNTRPQLGLHRNATLNLTFAEELFSPVLKPNRPRLGSFNSICGLLSPLQEKTLDFKLDKKNVSRPRGLTDDSLTLKLKDSNAINGEEEIIASIHDSVKFEEQAAKHGHEVKVLEEGDSLGNLGLRHNNVKITTAICKADCEFLVINKAQFDEIFQKKGKQKELFLKEVFPFLVNAIVSTTALNMVLYSFKVSH